MALPWREIVKALPLLAGGARELWKYWSSRPKPKPVDPAGPIEPQLAGLAERVASLEATEERQSQLVAEVANQLEGVAHRAQRAYWFGLAALVLAVAALLLALFR